MIGLGAMGKEHAKFFKQDIRGARLVAVVDQIRGLAESVGSQLGVKPYTTIDEAVKDPDVDVVCIATPTYLHVPQALYALEYGKHVLVEKPMSTTILGARQIIARARKKGLKLGVDFMERYSDGMLKLKSAISKGDLGKVFLIEGENMEWRDEKTYYLRDQPARSWRGMWETEGGGALTNQGIHNIDSIIALAGQAKEVAAFVRNLTHPSVEVEDNGVAVMTFEKGYLGRITHSVSTRPDGAQFRRIRVYGSEGQAEITGHELTLLKTAKENVVSAHRWQEETEGDYHTLYVRLIQDFIDSILEDREFQVNGEEGIKSLELIKAIYLSSQTHQVVTLPLEVEAVI